MRWRGWCVGEWGYVLVVVEGVLKDGWGGVRWRVEIGVDGVVKEDGFLGNDGKGFVEVVVGDVGDVYVVV